MVTCSLCGSEEVYRGLDRRKRFWLWYFLMILAGLIPWLLPLYMFAGIAFVVIPFTGESVCRNCGFVQG